MRLRTVRRKRLIKKLICVDKKLLLSIVCANFSRPSMFDEAVSSSSFFSRHSCANCIEELIELHIDSSIVVPKNRKSIKRGIFSVSKKIYYDILDTTCFLNSYHILLMAFGARLKVRLLRRNVIRKTILNGMKFVFILIQCDLDNDF